MISVIIPTYSRPKNLIRAINSVTQQTYKDIEIIVVDDNGLGTSAQLYTKQLVQSYIDANLITYIAHTKNLNGSAARNTGFYASRGDYIAFLDDDDEFVPQKLELQLKQLEQLSEEWGGCYCDTELISTKSNTKHIYPCLLSGDLTVGMLMESIFFNTSTLLIRRKVIENLHGFNESYKRHQDWEFLIRFFRNYKLKLTNAGVPLLKRYTDDSTPFAKIKGKGIYKLKKKFLTEFKYDIYKYPEANDIMLHHWLSTARYLKARGSFIYAAYSYIQALKYKYSINHE